MPRNLLSHRPTPSNPPQPSTPPNPLRHPRPNISQRAVGAVFFSPAIQRGEKESTKSLRVPYGRCNGEKGFQPCGISANSDVKSIQRVPLLHSWKRASGNGAQTAPLKPLAAKPVCAETPQTRRTTQDMAKIAKTGDRKKVMDTTKSTDCPKCSKSTRIVKRVKDRERGVPGGVYISCSACDFYEKL